MKSMLLSLLIIAALVVILLRPWTRDGGQPPGGGPPTERFLSSCHATAAHLASADAYCRCLWERGVRSPTETLASPAGRTAAEACSRPSDR